MPQLFARKVPTTDRVLFRYSDPAFIDLAGRHRDVEITGADGQVRARFRWDKASKPDRRNKTVTLNCLRYRLQWLPDLRPRKQPS